MTRLLWIALLAIASVANGIAALAERSDALALVLYIFYFTFAVFASLEWRHYWHEKEKEEEVQS